MSNIKFGCEVYTWFMDEWGEVYKDKLDHMMGVAKKAGFTGIEPMHFWLGKFSTADTLGAALKENDINLAGIALVLDWLNPEETEEEIAKADDCIALCKEFGAMCCTVQMPTERPSDEGELHQRRQNLIDCVNAVHRRAHAAGVGASFHPNSPETSINRTEADYDHILPGLDAGVGGWTPDVGHIHNGGMDALTKMKQYADLVNHVHYKDWNPPADGDNWAITGEGTVDFPAITQWLVDQNFDGWI
ncbi:MAG: sugar phosphate isomerase/epimerase family protein, partial [Verrucomicrobiota bacterium]